MTNAAKAKDKDNITLRVIEQLFCASKIAYKDCYSLYRPDQPWLQPCGTQGPIAPALYYAALGGLLKIVECLLDQGADVNARGGTHENALQAALYEGHEHIVRLLVEKGADVNAQSGGYGNALCASSYRGYK